MIDFKSRPYMAKLYRLCGDCLDLQELIDDLNTLIDNEGEITIKNTSVQIELFTSDILNDLKTTQEFKIKELNNKIDEIKNLIYGSTEDN